MEVALIAPTPLLWTVGSMTRYHMVLPEVLVASEDYRTFYRGSVGYKILDNGVSETGRPLAPTELMDLALSQQVDEIVVPDIMGNADGTIELAEQFKRTVPRLLSVKYMGVAQGTIMSDFYRCVEYWLAQDWVSTIAFPRCIQIRGDHARWEAVEYWQDDILGAGKDIHCLGSTQDITEVKALSNLHIRGIDTCMPIDFARSGLNLQEVQNGPNRVRYLGRTDGYFDWVPSEDQNRLVVQNCNTYLEWAQWEGFYGTVQISRQDDEAPEGGNSPSAE
jgi:hypothetical protein